MKKETKFTLEKFQVAKLKNLEKFVGGNLTPVEGNGDPLPTITVIVNGRYSDKCKIN